MHDVFISYSHKDVQIADAICHKFEAAGIRCWYAPRNIPPGEEWADAIIKALEDTKLMILVFTDDSNVSTQVHREVDAAISYGKTIIPFKCSDAEPTGSMKYYLSTLHWLDAMNKSREKSIQNLLEYTKRALAESNITAYGNQQKQAGPATAGTSKAATSAGKPKNKKLLLYGIIGVVGVVLIAIGLMNINKNKQNAESSAGTKTQSEQTAEVSGASENKTEAETPEEKAETAAQESTADTSQEGVEASQDNTTGDEATQNISTQEVPRGGSADKTSQSTYSYDESKDSPGAEDYLYTVLSSGGHKNSVRVDLYFGEETSVIEIPEIIDGLPVTEIGEKCFADCDYIEKVVLPETIEYIGYRAFYWCTNLTEMNFPASLTGWGDWAFDKTGFINIVVPENFESLGAGSLYGCPNLETVVLSDKVTKIKKDTFFQDGALISVTIPGEEVEIEPSAFDRNADLTIIGVKGSYTERFAKGMGFHFEEYVK